MKNNEYDAELTKTSLHCRRTFIHLRYGWTETIGPSVPLKRIRNKLQTDNSKDKKP